MIPGQDNRARWQARSLAMRGERFSARTFDAEGGADARWPAEVREILEEYGAIHVQNTGIREIADVLRVMPGLGFGAAEQFRMGGRTSAQTQEKWAAPGLRRMDWYPPDLYLLPNNEVQYRRTGPRRVLFACLTAPADGGRIFLHQTQAVEAELRASATELLDRILRHGLCIETGFLDAGHPAKAHNYFQSWQERFATDDPDTAIARARAEVDEYDRCWWRDEPGEAHRTLMTRITFAASWHGHLRFPRVALDPPALQNGWRRFPLGDGTDLTPAEEDQLRAAFFATREGAPLRDGDLVLFDNLSYGHSRESFTGAREVYVGMAGELCDPSLETPADAPAAPPGAAPAPISAFAGRDGQQYHVPPEPERRFSARTFDAAGGLNPDQISPVIAAEILREFSRYGALHLKNTGVRAEHAGDLPEPVLQALGFGGADAFPWGGMSSGRTVRKALSRELRATDDYPPHLWLLPHNEVLYQRDLPARLLFFSATDCAPGAGGRTFVHASAGLEARLRRFGAAGAALIGELERHGLLIEMGFLHEDHPVKPLNFFRSWQDRFGTRDRDEAEARCRAARHQFDNCWWRSEPGGLDTLMTRIRVPAFHDGSEGRGPEGRRMLFPRIALDGPAAVNGWRRYPLGDGRALTEAEIGLLIGAFLATREAVRWQAGDILLVDNLRHGHSREAYTGERRIGVAMAGSVTIRQAPPQGTP